MRNKLMLAALIVVGVLTAPAVQADDGICEFLDAWFGYLPEFCPTPQSASHSAEKAGWNDVEPHCLGCGGLPTAPGDRAGESAVGRVSSNAIEPWMYPDGAPLGAHYPDYPVREAASAGKHDVGPPCLACGGPPTPPSDPN